MTDIETCTATVTTALDQQSAATHEISRNVTGAADGSKAIVTVLAEVASAAVETRQSAQTVLDVAAAVEHAAANLRGEVESFLAEVAA